MILSEKIEAAARLAGCEDKISAVDAVMESLQDSRTKNVAVLGETNCGKTSLINKIAGVQVREPTNFSMDERPLMVTFGSGGTKPGYEVVDVRDSICGEARISLYEIPMNMALDGGTRQVKPMLEEMDAVIYIISAVTPFTATDAENIGAVVNKFPMILYVSKTELLEDGEYDTVTAYIRDEFAGKFDGAACEILDSRQPDAVEAIVEGLREISLEELREFHVMRLEQQAKNIVAEELRQQTEQLDAERKAREADRAAKDAEYRKQLLGWETLRIGMREREQEAVDAVNQKITASKTALKEKLACQIMETRHKKEWVNHELKKVLQRELRAASNQAAADLKDKTAADAAWLVSEVNRKSGIKIEVEDMDREPVKRLPENPGSAAEEPGYSRIAAAAGTGLLAGGAIFSGMSLLPTCMVAIPASLATYYLLKGDSEEREQYNRELVRMTEKCCDENFAALEDQICGAVHKHYERMTESIKKLSMPGETETDFGDIAQRREKISDMLEELA